VWLDRVLDENDTICVERRFFVGGQCAHDLPFSDYGHFSASGERNVGSAGVSIDPTPSHTVGRRERNKAEKLSQIRRAAARLIIEHGFDDMTTEQVATEAGVAKGTLFLYAPTKQHLLALVFVDLIGEAWETAFERFEPGRPIVDEIVDLFGRTTDYHEQNPLLSRAMLLELPFVDGPPADEVEQFMTVYLDRLAAVLAAAVESGQLRPETPVRELALALFSVWQNIAQRRYVGRIDYQECTERHRHHLTAVLAGYLTAGCSGPVGRPRLPARPTIRPSSPA